MRERKDEGRHVDKRGKIENPVQSFDLLRPSDSIEAAQVSAMDRVGSNAESEIIFMTRINLPPMRRYGHSFTSPECSESANLLPLAAPNCLVIFFLATTRVQIKPIVG